MNRILIDTNIYSSALRGRPEITATLQQVSHIGISVVTVGELFSGFLGGTRERQNRQELAFFLDSPRVQLYPVDEETAEFYSNTLNLLRRNGTPIPTNDIWIAATALQHGLKLFTLDRHFQNIPGLLLV